MGADVYVFDPDGSVPATISSVVLSGPGIFSYDFVAGDYSGANEYYHIFDGLPADGEYTFTATNNNGKTATCSFYLTVGQTIPIPDSSKFQASGADPLTPTLSWSTIPGYEGTLFYRARIYDEAGNTIYRSNFSFNSTSFTVPSGVLSSGQTYAWRVEALDNFNYYNANNRGRSKNIPLNIDNTHPYFTSVGAFQKHNSDGTFATGLFVQGADPAGAISSLVITYPNGVAHPYPSPSCFTSSDTCNYSLPGAPADGLYTFTATNSDNNTAVSSFHLASYAVPLVDSTTMHASGSALTPVLSWSAPAAIDRPLYYYVFVRDALSQATVWSDWTLVNAISVPTGKLQAGASYEWQIVANDSSYFATSNRSLSPWKALTVDNDSPYFWYASLYDRHEPDGDFTGVSANVRDRNGAFPGNLASLTVTGPKSFSYSFQPGDYYVTDNEFWQVFPGTPEEGLYTFTLTDHNGTSVVTHVYHRQGAGTIPLLDEESFQVYGDPLAPTISWSPVANYPYHLNYRVRIKDQWGNTVFAPSQPFGPNLFQVVPAGRLVAGPSYTYRVEAFDSRYFYACDNRVVSSYHSFGVPSISGRVTDGQGKGIANISVQAYDAAAGASKPSVPTDQDGNYTLSNLPSGNYKISFSGVGYFTEWYNNKTSQPSADLVTVTAPSLTSGIDAVLERSGGISGTVKNGQGVGIKNIWVGIFDANGYYLFGTPTNQDGNYTASGLATGNYKVCFNAVTGYRTEWYNNKATQADADLVAVTVPNITSGIDAVLEPGGSISGTIKNGQGAVIANVQVLVYGLNGIWAAGVMTNQNGVYTVNGLPTDSYKIFFSGVGYYSEWYNNKASQDAADPVSVTAPNLTSGIDAVLEQSGSISGTVKNGQGVGIGNVNVQVFDTSGYFASSTMSGSNGAYTVSSLAAGNYKVCFNGPSGYRTEWYDNRATQDLADWVTVTVPNITSGIDAVLEPGGSISGTIKNGQGAVIANVQVLVYGINGTWTAGAMTNQNGVYTVNGLPTGSYKIFFSGVGYYSEWYNNKASQDAADPVSVTAPQITSGIDAVLEPSGSISGTVKNGQGVGLGNVNVQVFDTSGYFASSTMSGSNGAYTVSSLAAGNYKVCFYAPSGYRTEWYNDKAGQDLADWVAVTVPNVTSGIDAVLEPGGASPAPLRMDKAP